MGSRQNEWKAGKGRLGLGLSRSPSKARQGSIRPPVGEGPPPPLWCREGRLRIKISFSTARLRFARHVYYYGSPSASHCNSSPTPRLFFVRFKWRPGGSSVLPRWWVRGSAMVSGEGPHVWAGLLPWESRGCLCLSRGALFGPKMWASEPGVSVGQGHRRPLPRRLGWEKGEQAALIGRKQHKCVFKVSPRPQQDSAKL